MITINDNKNCCGCSACMQKCPKNCITMQEDKEGFLYPIIDLGNCIDCGLCEKVCPFLNINKPIYPISTLAVKNKNFTERINSSSGGVFIELAKSVIEKGGVVFGAIFDNNWEVKHSYAETIENVYPMMGSKYLQSRIEKTYNEAEIFLKQGRMVLFSGSPCQISGLQKYLRKDYSNLLCVDFLCHGVPSPKVWRKYINQLTNFAFKNCKETKQENISIKNINFRSKTTGWKKFCLNINYSISSDNDNIKSYSNIHRNNPYMKVFLADIILRPSCYKCKCKNGISHSDLTIADYWGIEKIMPDFDDDNGVGLVLINTQKGKEYLDKLPMEVRQSSLNDARLSNGGFKETLTIHPKRDFFFSKLDECDNVINLMELCTKPSIKNKILKFSRRIYHKIKSYTR